MQMLMDLEIPEGDRLDLRQLKVARLRMVFDYYIGV